ncbi:MAG TPA: hypothetical protein VFS44_10305 [Gemmatimonadaceae bacterium]|nr:hypothetical protein [Gemmatimonadaceae bacterium]
MAFWDEWRVSRDLRARAGAFVASLCVEPAEGDVAWLAASAAGGDADHARWELRYARRALGLLAAQRDALDDRTASVVARALGEALARDPAIAPGKLRVAERQLNARLRAYGEALANRAGAGSGWHLGRTLLEFAGHRDAVPPELVARASEILSHYLAEANASLRERFGSAALPEHEVPSSIARSARR